MAQDTFCAGCDRAIDDEASDNRKPCPACGSTGRRYSLTLSGALTVTSSLKAELQVKRYPEVLLDTARQLIERQEFGVATVVVHMACEVATDHALSGLFKANGVGHLEESVGEFLNGFNLANQKLRGLYNSLSREAIEQQPFWHGFVDSARRRNGIMHKGARATEAEARESLRVGEALVQHLQKREQ